MAEPSDREASCYVLYVINNMFRDVREYNGVIRDTNLSVISYFAQKLRVCGKRLEGCIYYI